MLDASAPNEDLQLHVARDAAQMIARAGSAAIAERGRFLLAVSGGETPRPMFAALAAANLDWSRVELFQVDERVAPRGSSARNLSTIESVFGSAQIHAMPVERADLRAAASAYEAVLQRAAGTPPVLDLIHLGLGDDGHTASLFADDAAVNVTDADVAITAPHADHLRMTLTLPMINRARARLWLVCGARKCAIAGQLRAGDPAIVASRVHRQNSWLVTDCT